MISQVARELARVIRFLCHDGVTVLLIEQNLKLAAEVADRLATMGSKGGLSTVPLLRRSAPRNNRSAVTPRRGPCRLPNRAILTGENRFAIALCDELLAPAQVFRVVR
jgi:energy-coupling factor transporter ATP-binding protein EcfA2